jgi:hypothetical protein
MQPHYRINHIDVFWLIILTNVTLGRSNIALPDDGDYTETCRSCFNVNFNVNFKIVFKTIQLCISWWIEKETLILKQLFSFLITFKLPFNCIYTMKGVLDCTVTYILLVTGKKNNGGVSPENSQIVTTYHSWNSCWEFGPENVVFLSHTKRNATCVCVKLGVSP